jgi:RNA polymerase sigma-70 factor (ECF subfamily)
VEEDRRSDAHVIAASLDDPEVFSALYDRHAGLLFRYLIRRVGRDTADELLGETFRIAFERRATFDCERPDARPWMYGIATNLLAKHRRSEARRLHATARLAAAVSPLTETDTVIAAVDASVAWPKVAEAITQLPDGERDALLLYAWEDLRYQDVAAALDVPVGTVRSRINRARTRLRELFAASGREPTTVPAADTFQPDHPNDPWALAQERERLMSVIAHTGKPTDREWKPPAIYPRLAYRDEMAAIEFLSRAFGFVERREARMDGDDKWGTLAWLEHRDGVVMVGRTEREVHQIVSPLDTGGQPTCILNISVEDVDAHYEKAQAEGARIVMEINDAFYGFRRYEALDPEGNRWHFTEPLSSVEQRRGTKS